jgi:hypothetical protein
MPHGGKFVRESRRAANRGKNERAHAHRVRAVSALLGSRALHVAKPISHARGKAHPAAKQTSRTVDPYEPTRCGRWLAPRAGCTPRKRPQGHNGDFHCRCGTDRTSGNPQCKATFGAVPASEQREIASAHRLHSSGVDITFSSRRNMANKPHSGGFARENRRVAIEEKEKGRMPIWSRI